MTAWELWARDKDLQRVALLEDVLAFEARARMNAGGDWTMTLPADSPAVPYLRFAAGSQGRQGVILKRDGVTVFSGRVREIAEVDDGDRSTVEVVGVDDTAILADRVVFPNPFARPPWTTAHDTRTGRASTLMYQYVDVNMALSALPERREAGIAFGTDSGLGTVVTKSARLQNLLEWLAEIARPDGLRFEILQDDDVNARITFRVGVPADKTQTVFFSHERGNLASSTAVDSAAGATTAIVGAGGEGTARAFTEGSDPTSSSRYGLRELFVDRRDTVAAAEMAVAVTEALAEHAGGQRLELAPVDTDAVEYWRDYGLGDRVTAYVGETEAVGYVSELRFQLGEAGWTVTPVVTTAVVATTAPGSRVGALGRRLTRLEANAEMWTPGDVKGWARAIADIPAGPWQLADGTNGTIDLRGRFLVGADGSGYALGATGGAATVNLQHSHTILAANLAHSHGGGTLQAADHSHADGTLAAAAHAHAAGTLAAASHDHGAGTLAAASHSHGAGSHTHTVNIDHNHPEFQSGQTNVDTVAVGHASLGSGTTDHHHAVNPPALGTTNVTSGGGSGSTDGAGASVSGSTASVGAAVSGSTDSVGADVTGSTAASGALALSGSTASGQPAANVTSENALGAAVDARPPYTAIYLLQRIY